MTYSGNYPMETREGEIERLHVQGAAMAPDTERMLDLIGVNEGWSCLDIGCGPGGITSLLARRAGEAGRVVGLDMNEVFLEHARKTAPSNVTFEQGDAYGSDLEPGGFDLAHMRFVAATAGGPERLIAEATRLVRTGGIVAMQEPDASSLNCFPSHRAWDRLKNAMIDAFGGVGANVLELPRSLYSLMLRAGLEDVQMRPFIVGVRAQDPMVDYLPSTVESMRGTVTKLAIMNDAELDETLAEARSHLAKIDTSFTMYTVYQVWGRKG